MLSSIETKGSLQSRPTIKFDIRLTRNASQQLLKLIAEVGHPASALSSIHLQDEDSEEVMREEARNAFDALVKSDCPYVCYLRRGRRNDQYDDKFELFFATDVRNEANQVLAEHLNNRAFVLTGLEKSDNYYRYDRVLLITSVNVLSFARGYTTQFDIPIEAIYVSPSKARTSSCGIPSDVGQRIRKLPNYEVEKLTVEKRLNDWRAYLSLVERLANEKKYKVKFTHYRWETGRKSITLTLASGLTDDVKTKIRNSTGEWIFIKEASDKSSKSSRYGFDDASSTWNDDDEDNWSKLGTVRDFWPESGELRVEMDDDLGDRIANDYFKMPSSGVLEYRADGELIQINRLKFGLESLSYGRAKNARLSEFMFDPTKAGLPNEHVSLDENDLLLKTLAGNKEQKAAVEGVLSAPDLFLIQGPPGTGKTTVIAEICYQIARRGGRTLVASQANLAVDNALSRLVHHPSIRALRRGKADRVEIEGEPYLEDHVVSTWLENTAKSCQEDLVDREIRMKRLESVLLHRADMERMALLAKAFSDRNATLLDKIKSCESTIENCIAELDESNGSLAETASAISTLQSFEERIASYKSTGHASQNLISQYDTQFDGLLPFGTSVFTLVSSMKKLMPLLSQWYPSKVQHISTYVNLHPKSVGIYTAVLVVLDVVADIKAKEAEIQAGLTEIDKLCDGLLELVKRERDLKACVLAKADQVQQLNTERERADIEHLQHCKNLEALKLFADTLKQSWFEIDRWIRSANGAIPRIEDLPIQLRPDISRLVWPVAVEPIRRSQQPQPVALQPQALRVQIDELKRLSETLTEFAVDVWPYVQHGKEADRTQDRWLKSELSLLVRLSSNGMMCAAPNALNMVVRLHSSYKSQKSSVINKLLSRFLSGSSDNQLFVDLQLMSSAIEKDILLLETQYQEAKLMLSEPTSDGLTGQVLKAALHETSKFIDVEERKLKEIEAVHLTIANSYTKLRSELDDSKSKIEELHRRISWHLREINELKKPLQSETQYSSLLFTLPAVNAPVEQLYGYINGWLSNWRKALIAFNERFNEIVTVTAKLNPLEALSEQITALAIRHKTAHDEKDRLQTLLAGKERELAALKGDVVDFCVAHQTECEWWKELHKRIPAELLVAETISITDVDYVISFLGRLKVWQEQLNKERQNNARYRQYVQDWVGRIRQKDERDDGDLRRIYIDNANVIGITCVQAGNKQFSQDYRDFDCVIVDEVSKATPPELLLPILKGAKVVLVGDHKQLPPMVGSDSIRDLAEEINVPIEELEHLERSLFGELFNNCPPDLKCMLKTQYRMHPQIMDAINQFYDDGLECGMKDPDSERAHGCDEILDSKNHLVWLPTPVEPGFFETKIGHTYRNECELDLLVKFVERLDAAWGVARKQKSLPVKEVGVITFYASQANEIKKRLLERNEAQQFKNLNIRTGTVDRFQGMEKAIIIVSLVRNNDAGDIGFARAPERINVAFSRAQELLVIIGSKELYCHRANKRSALELYTKVADVVSEHKGWHDISEYR